MQCEQQTKIQSTVKEAFRGPYLSLFLYLIKTRPTGSKGIFFVCRPFPAYLKVWMSGPPLTLPRLSTENRRSVNRLDLTWQSSTYALATEGIPLKETEFIAWGFEVGNSVPVLCAPILLCHLHIENCWHNYIFPSLLQTKPILKRKFPFCYKSYLLKI